MELHFICHAWWTHAQCTLYRCHFIVLLFCLSFSVSLSLSLSSPLLSSPSLFPPPPTLCSCRIIVGAPSGTFPGGLNLDDPGMPRAERSGLVYACPVQPGTCAGVRGDTTRYLGAPDAVDNNPCVDDLTLTTFPQSYIEGRLFDQARKPFYICLVIATAIFFWHGFIWEGGRRREHKGIPPPPPPPPPRG